VLRRCADEDQELLSQFLQLAPADRDSMLHAAHLRGGAVSPVASELNPEVINFVQRHARSMLQRRVRTHHQLGPPPPLLPGPFATLSAESGVRD
jgi:hypothetical protein